MGERQHVAILGGGIRGASIAGMLTATGNFDISVIERQAVAAGTTSTNHGRFHSGTWNYTENEAPFKTGQK
jgi:L-2-hydroxyglutarate oxidase LhgO